MAGNIWFIRHGWLENSQSLGTSVFGSFLGWYNFQGKLQDNRLGEVILQ